MAELLSWSWLFTLPGLVLTAMGVPAGQRRAGWASLPGPVVLLLVALVALVTRGRAEVEFPGWLPFLPDGAFRLLADPLSALMLVVLGLVAACVYLYSLGYMVDDPARRRFFVYLDLFVAAMALLVLAGNLAVLLIGWTGVGISSFLLISFWRDRPHTLGAGLQALAANAIGDGALLLALVLVPAGCGRLTDLGSTACSSSYGGAELLALLLFVAAAAKSAQGPLYFWLPSAMAGPTPISALIHAATMVAAGVYLLVRTHVLFEHAPTVALWVAAVGVATAIGASLASLVQFNFKRAIAYSTVAQLGYMFAAAGVGAPFAALFHLFTHAFFKALLFLSAGVVIHGEGGEESLTRLSGRGRKYRVSHVGFLVGSLALIGVPFFSGAFSKDLVIEAALERQPLLGYLLLGSVALTGLYVGRLFWRVYHGLPAADTSFAQGVLASTAPELPETAALRQAQGERGSEGAALRPGQGEPVSEAGQGPGAHARHDVAAGRWMDAALVPLAVLAVLAGFVVWPSDFMQVWLYQSVFAEWHAVQPVSPLGLVAAALGLLGFGGSWLLVRGRQPVAAPAEVQGAAKWVSTVGEIGLGAGRGISALTSGALPRYAYWSLLALAALLLLGVLAR